MRNLDLTSLFRTKAEAQDFSTRLSVVGEKIYENNFNLENVLSEQFGIKKKDILISLLRDNGINTENRTVLKEFIDEVQKNVSSLPILSVQIAFEPKENTLQVVSDWFILNLKKQVLIDIKVDTSLIAGAAVFYNGRYKDFSVKTRFESILNNALKNKIVNSQPNQQSPHPPIGHQSAEHVVVGR